MVKRYIYSILILIILCPSWAIGQGQNAAYEDEGYTPVVAGPDEKLIMEIKIKMQEYIANMNDLIIAVSVYPADSLNALQRTYKMVDSKWNTYYQAEQMDIATSDELLNLVAQYQLLSQSASEALTKMDSEVNAQESFLNAKTFIIGIKPEYEEMYKEAMALQMINKLAPQLEKLKAKEQTIFADVETNYQQARSAASTNPKLAELMSEIDDDFFDIKNTSTAIQSAVYKPIIQRIKDKLLVAAAMAIIMMFVSMVVSKLQALKKARDMAKKFKSQFQNDQQYPTI